MKEDLTDTTHLPAGLIAKLKPQNFPAPVDNPETTPNSPPLETIAPPTQEIPIEPKHPSPTPPPSGKKSSGLADRKPLFVILFTIFIDLLGFGLMLPIIPLLLADPQSSFYLLPKNFTLNQGYILLGFLTATYPLMQFFSTPILGQLSDKHGRKLILAFSIAGACISYILFEVGVLTQNIPLLFVSRAFSGLTGGNISVAQAAIADITPPKDRAKTFGLIGAVFGIGFILGPYIGGKLSDPAVFSWFNAATPFLFAALLSFFNCLSVLAFYPETLKERRTDLQIKWSRSIMNIIHAYSIKKLRILFITNFLFQGGFTFYTTFFSVYLIYKFHFTQGNIGDFFSYVGVWIAITQALITRKLTSILGEKEILRFSLIGTGTAVILFLFPNIWWQLLIITPFFAIFNGLSQANMTALISRSADQKMQGEILGINSSVQALAQAIPPILSGFIAAGLAANAPIYVSSIVIVIAGLLFVFRYKSDSTEN